MRKLRLSGLNAVSQGCKNLICTGLAVLVTALGVSHAEESRPELLRIQPGSRSGSSVLQVPIVHYVASRSGRTVAVDFVGAVHLGQKSYFEQLNRVFRRYEAVLFELIADSERLKDLRPREGTSTIGMVQKKLSSMLGLEFQLDAIDYGAKNFVHADMNPDQLAKAMTDRGETLPKLLMRMFALSFDPKLKKTFEKNARELEQINPITFLMRDPTDDERRMLRGMMARGLASSEELLTAFEGTDGLSITTDRNKVALAVLKSQLEKGQRKLAIYYGVGHLPDMHERLVSEFGLRVTGADWVDAWEF